MVNVLPKNCAVFGVFLAQKLHGKSYTVVGDGMQSRDFTYVEDVANAFYSAAQSNITNDVFNVGSSNHYNINRLVELLGGPVTYIPKRPGEPDCTFADISKVKRSLGWEAKISFEEGVQRILDTIEDFRDAPVWEPQSIEEATKIWFQYLEK
jgi:UDP-glucose 4-epimerase